MTDCTDCNRELDDEETIRLSYQLLDKKKILIEWEVPVCETCFGVRAYVMDKMEGKA